MAGRQVGILGCAQVVRQSRISARLQLRANRFNFAHREGQRRHVIPVPSGVVELPRGHDRRSCGACPRRENLRAVTLKHLVTLILGKRLRGPRGPRRPGHEHRRIPPPGHAAWSGGRTALRLRSAVLRSPDTRGFGDRRPGRRRSGRARRSARRTTAPGLRCARRLAARPRPEYWLEALGGASLAHDGKARRWRPRGRKAVDTQINGIGGPQEAPGIGRRSPARADAGLHPRACQHSTAM